MTIVGIQLHHSTRLNDAYRHLVNAVGGLASALDRCPDNELYRELHDESITLLRRVGRTEEAARAQMQELHETDPDTFRQARDGIIPWPGESHPKGFQPRCFCNDRCLYHDHGVVAALMQCNCGTVCPAHPDKAPRRVPDA